MALGFAVGASRYLCSLAFVFDYSVKLFVKFVAAAMEERKRRESNGVGVSTEKVGVYVE